MVCLAKGLMAKGLMVFQPKKLSLFKNVLTLSGIVGFMKTEIICRSH